MPQVRVSAFVAFVALCGATVGLSTGVVSAAPTAPPHINAAGPPACPAASRGHVTCFAHIAGPAATTAPTGLSPGAVATAYAFPPGDGAGETVAIVDAYNDPTATADLATFSSEYGLPPCTIADGCLAQVNQTGAETPLPGNSTGWGLEISLDIQWAHAIAPAAHILLVEANSSSLTDMFSAVRFAAQHAQYVNMSWGSAEFVGETALDKSFTATPGVSFFASSGDKAAEVEYPSASPAVISVGGTTLDVTASTSAWKSETAWSTAGGGCSLYEPPSPAQAAYPTYDQSGANCAGMRSTPDVAFDANPTTGVSVYDTFGTGGGWLKVGGTSVASVLMTSRSAISGSTVDAASVYGSDMKLYNVITGSNGHPCESGYSLCAGLGSWNTAVGVLGGGSTGTGGAGSGTLSLTPGAQALVAGVPSPTTVVLSSPAPAGGLGVTVSATSAGVASSSAGPFSSTITATVPAGQSTSASFYVEATTVGSATLRASATGWATGDQTDSVAPGPLARIIVSPASASLAEGTTQVFGATGYDAYGNTVPMTPVWSVPAVAGTLSSSTGPETTLTAGTTPVTVTLSATSGTITGTASVAVTGPSSMQVSLSDSTPKSAGHRAKVPVTLTATGAAGPVAGANVTVQTYAGLCGGTLVATSTGVSNSSGTWSSNVFVPGTGVYCFLATVSAAGYRTATATLSVVVGSTTKKVASVPRDLRLL